MIDCTSKSDSSDAVSFSA